MLTALENGVKGGKWFSLMDKVYSLRALRAAWRRVRANRGAAGVDHQSIAMFESDLERNLRKLSEDLRAGRYQPGKILRVWIPKPGRKGEKRPLGIPTIRDRVVQTALKFALEPVFERDFAQRSYGFRPGRGCKDALRRVEELLKSGHSWVVDADLKSFFDTIPKERLLEQVETRIADGRVLGLIESYLNQQVMEGTESWTPQGGTPQGAIISPLLANVYLDPLDHQMEETGFEMVRYADDFVVLCRSESEAQRALETIRCWVEEAGLKLHPDKTGLVDTSQPGGFEFLGYHFDRGTRKPSRKSLQRHKDAVRAETKRCNGKSLDAIIGRLNRIRRGWFEYYKHSHRRTFRPLDGWTRMRLRSILRKRHGGRGRGRGRDQRRWPNAYFAKHGFFSLSEAHELACQAAWR
jgi:RNA-directed DNA polymerase